MQYYEMEFIDYENYLTLTGNMDLLNNLFKYDNPYAKSDFVLHKFQKYEEFEKTQRRKEWQRFIKNEHKRKDQGSSRKSGKGKKQAKLKQNNTKVIEI